MSKYLKFLIPIFILFIGFKVNAKGLMIITNGVVQEQCSNCDELNVTSEAFITNYRAVLDPKSFTQNDTYYFSVLFETQTLGTSIDVTDCGLNINGAYVTPSSRNSYRITNAQHGNFWTIRFQTEMTYIASSSLSNVPVFIQCDTTPAAQTDYVTFVDTETNDNTATGISIANQTRDLIANNNSNTNSIIQSISNFVSGVSTGFNNVTSGISTGVSNIVSGISSTLSSVGTAITNKIGELIDSQEVCTTFYSTKGEVVITSTAIDNFVSGRLDSTGNLILDSSWNTTGYIPISYNSSYKFNTANYSSSNINSSYFCTYRSDKSLVGCLNYDNDTEYINTSSNRVYLKYSYPVSRNINSSFVGDCHKTGLASIFSKIGAFFNSFKDFLFRFFDNTLGLSHITEVLNRHKGILENSAFNGISDIINAPRNFISGFDNYTCSDISFTIFGDRPFAKSITLPSGCLFWHREDVSSFRVFWNALFGGFLIYKFAYRLFKVLNDCLDPTKDDIGGLEV